MKEALLNPNELVPELYSVRYTSRSHFSWLRRIFSPAKSRSSYRTLTPLPNPKTINSSGTQMFNQGRFTEALEFYDRAIKLSPMYSSYHSDRAAALSRLGRTGEAVNSWEEAIKLDPNNAKARYGLAMFLLSLGLVDDARKLVEESSDNAYYMDKVKQVEEHLNKCTYARKGGGNWHAVLDGANHAMWFGAKMSLELAMCKAEALLKTNRIAEAKTALAAVPKIEPFPASFSQSQAQLFDMNCRAYTFFVQSQVNFGLGRYKDAAEALAKAIEIEPHNFEIKILKKKVDLIQRALSSSMLEKWDEAVRDYELLNLTLPNDKVIAETLSQARVALKLSRSEAE